MAMNIKLTSNIAGALLTLACLGASAEESHMAAALTHADAAAKASDAKAIAEHAGMSKEHAGVADQHLDAGLKSLDSAIEHGKLGHADLAKKAAEEAVVHLKAAQ
jgi:hypothetical protein